MIKAISIICFAAGILVFFLIVRKQKVEEEYYDRFYFIVSKHNTFSEYIKLSNKLRDAFIYVRARLYKFNEKYLFKTQFHNLVLKAGYYKTGEATLFYLIASIVYLIVLIVLVIKVLSASVSVASLPCFSIVYYIAVKFYLERKHMQEIRKFRTNFIYFLDLMATCIKTGMTFNASLDVILPLLHRFSPLLGHSMQDFSNTLKYASLDEACDRIYQEVPLTEVQEFNATVKNSIQFGTGMSSSLQTLAMEIRQFHFIETEEKIGAVNAKMGIPLILFIMFPVIVEIIAPGLLRAMQNMSLDMIS
ncbi:type II secretion system F family protein [Enterobacteriaceae bacterium BIT-l23]|uniref:type II secretion system F family protein n=1 Tax=Jejubacter sp. L23 TaxID=3092086 RepID=UPI001585A6CB|nr:type II secretion system F family protein [Enterobacteriaceae bacterium BIT-l23]